MQPNQPLGFRRVHTFLTSLFEGDLHAKRVLSLANATLGVIRTASLAVHAVGLGLAQARGLKTKHAIKQVDRLLSNEGIDIDAALRHWAPYVAVLHRSKVWAQLPQSRLGSGGADGDRACECQHTVEGMDGDLHLGCPPAVRA